MEHEGNRLGRYDLKVLCIGAEIIMKGIETSSVRSSVFLLYFFRRCGSSFLILVDFLRFSFFVLFGFRSCPYCLVGGESIVQADVNPLAMLKFTLKNCRVYSTLKIKFR